MNNPRIIRARTDSEVEHRQIKGITLGLASPERILQWSHGEVKKPETFNYRTYKPERDGLFCERIFGPTKDYECACGKYKKIRYKGTICERCGVEVTSSRVRRERIGHIRLASPVAHIWFTKSIPNVFSALLGINSKEIEKVIYFVNWIVVDKDDKWLSANLSKITTEAEKRKSELEAEKNKLREIKELDLFEVCKQVPDLTSHEKREITEAEKAFNARSKDEKTLERYSFMKEVITRSPELRDYEALESITDPKTREVIVRGDEHQILTPAIVSKLIDLRRFRIKVESRKKSIEITKRLEEINQEIKNLTEGLEKITKCKKLDRLTDKEQESVRTILRLVEVRLFPEITEYLKIGIGASAVQEILKKLDLNQLAKSLISELSKTVNQKGSSQKRAKLIKRLKIVRSFINSGNRPEWMIIEILPVLPPDLRPMVELEGGRFASSDLNDLYRRVINRNNRLKKLIEIRAPESILRNERRMLQEAVDSLIDNGRRGRSAVTVGNRPLKSLSDMLKGKHGRFRQNLLGKRVDYSGRSVIVVGPKLRLHQCGLPKEMALELFKSFVLAPLIDPTDPSRSIATARRLIEKAEDEKVWDALDKVIKAHPVLLNRAPTLHRLSIQAFEPVLIEGKAIQLHPLVCAAYNADFDGDQMAVHVPLSMASQTEARTLMLSANNLFLPADGKPIISASHDIVLGIYYLTQTPDGLPVHCNCALCVSRSSSKSLQSVNDHPLHKRFTSCEEALLAYENSRITLHEPIEVEVNRPVFNSEDFSVEPEVPKSTIMTTAGRILFNEIFWSMEKELGVSDDKKIPFMNFPMDKGALASILSYTYERLGQRFTVLLADALKYLGFETATTSGITVGINDLTIPSEKPEIIARADKLSSEIWSKFNKELITRNEKDEEIARIWDQATKDLTKAMKENFAVFNPVFMMQESGARGKIDQVRQLAGMRGLLVGPTGRVLDIPIKSNFREGLSVFEYFISTHGGRKGLVDTALKTADSGYLTRRLVDVAVDVSISERDCGTKEGIEVKLGSSRHETPKKAKKMLVGRVLAENVVAGRGGKVLFERGTEITSRIVDELFERKVESVKVRSVLTCESTEGVCALCYGWDLASGRLAEIGDPVGVIAAQSIGEPGTQLTMRTFHTGGIKGRDITQGLPYVESLFEVRGAKHPFVLAEREGVVKDITKIVYWRVVIQDPEGYTTKSYTIQCSEEEKLPITYQMRVTRGTPLDPAKKVVAEIGGIVTHLYTDYKSTYHRITIVHDDGTEKVYETPHENRRPLVQIGDRVEKAQPLCDGDLDIRQYHSLVGDLKTQMYLVNTIQDIYESQNVNTNSKHIEVIAKQMIKVVEVLHPGDAENLYEGDLVPKREFEILVAKLKKEGKKPPRGRSLLQGISKASLTTDSWLAAASFQETTRVLTKAAIEGQVDRLRGIKENVIAGSLIPVGTGRVVRDVHKALREGVPGQVKRFFEVEEEEEKPVSGLF